MAARCKECGGKLLLHELRTEELYFEIADDGAYREPETRKQGEYQYEVECESECEESGWWFNRGLGSVTENPSDAWQP